LDLQQSNLTVVTNRAEPSDPSRLDGARSSLIRHALLERQSRFTSIRGVFLLLYRLSSHFVAPDFSLQTFAPLRFAIPPAGDDALESAALRIFITPPTCSPASHANVAVPASYIAARGSDHRRPRRTNPHQSSQCRRHGRASDLPIRRPTSRPPAATREPQAYRYHPRWRAVRDENKFEHILDFGRVLPEIRRRVDATLRGNPASAREKFLARRGTPDGTHPSHARQSRVCGRQSELRTTKLKNRHVRISRGKIELDIRAKHRHPASQRRERSQTRRASSKLPRLCPAQNSSSTSTKRSVPHRHLGATSMITCVKSPPRNHAKDFRTWAATNLAVIEFCALTKTSPPKKSELLVIKKVAAQLATPGDSVSNLHPPRRLQRLLDRRLARDLASLELDHGLPEFGPPNAT